METHFELDGVKVPRFMYGTAWKEEATERLVTLALEAGFRAIDTANQRKHYHEVGVGAAVRAACARGLVRREDLFLQTKYTYVRGQDHRLPYDPAADYTTQVSQSFQSSLEHLGTDRLDSYVLHGPSTGRGLAEADWEVWEAMSQLKRAGKVRLLGVSNVTLDQLRLLHERAADKPRFVQNRCYARYGWDRGVRDFCREHGIAYQGFSLLTANPDVVGHPEVEAMAARLERTPEQVIFGFCLAVGMLPLTGTSDPHHMKEDLTSFDVKLEEAEVRRIESMAASTFGF